MPAPRLLSICILAGLVSIAFYIATLTTVQPEAGISLHLDRADAIARGAALAAAEGIELTGYSSAAVFSTDEEARNFFSRHVIPEEQEQLDSELICSWRARWYKPGQVEQFAAGFGPEGELELFVDVPREDADFPRLSAEEALLLARDFIHRQTSIDLFEYDQTQSVSKTLEKTVRHTFAWERPLFDGGATERLTASITGNKFCLFSRNIILPETWERSQQATHGQRALLHSVAKNARILFLLFGVFLVLFNFRLLKWRPLLSLGLVLAVLEVLQTVNYWPYLWYYYNARQSQGEYLVQTFLQMGLSSCREIAITLLVIAAANLAYGKYRPNSVPPALLARRWAWTSRQFLVAAVVGLTLGLAHLAYYNAFYLLAGQFGAWAPAQDPHSGLLDTMFPWLQGIHTGLSAALQEEMLYRAFMILLVLRYLRSKWAAVLLPAFAWGFMHVYYPQEPSYIRGIELTIVGVAYGLVMLRFGILATLVAHYTYNLISTCEVLFRTDSFFLHASAALAISTCLLPIAPGVYSLLRGRRLLVLKRWAHAPGPDVHKARRPLTPELPLQPYQPLVFWRLSLFVLVAMILCLAAVWAPRSERYADFYKVEVNSREAEQIARECLGKAGLDLAGYRAKVQFVSSLDTRDQLYVYQHLGLAGLNQYLREAHPDALYWSVSLFEPEVFEYHAVQMTLNGEVFRVFSRVSDDAPPEGQEYGGTAYFHTQEEALEVAKAYVQGQLRLDLSRFELVDHSSVQRKSRSDHTFTWEGLDKKVAGAPLQIVAITSAGKATYAYTRLKLPVKWREALKKEERQNQLAGMVVLAVIFCVVGIFFVHDIRKKRHLYLRPRLPLVLALATGAMIMVANLSITSQVWDDYQPPEAALTYLAGEIISFAAEPALAAVAVFLALLMADAVWYFAFPQRAGLELFLQASLLSKLKAQRPPGTAVAWAEALCLGGAGALALHAAIFLLSVIPEVPSPLPMEISSTLPISAAPHGFGEWCPALTQSLRGISIAPIALAGAMLLGAATHYLTRRIGMLLLCALFIFIAAIDLLTGTVMDIAYDFCATSIVLAAAYVSRKWFFRLNLPAYFLLAFNSFIMLAALRLVSQPDGFYFWNGVILLGLVGLQICAGILWRATIRATPSPKPGSEVGPDGGATAGHGTAL